MTENYTVRYVKVAMRWPLRYRVRRWFGRWAWAFKASRETEQSARELLRRRDAWADEYAKEVSRVLFFGEQS